jgi:hypothetical protein
MTLTSTAALDPRPTARASRCADHRALAVQNVHFSLSMKVRAGSVTPPLCTAARPLYTGFAERLEACNSGTTMQPSPTQS